MDIHQLIPQNLFFDVGVIHEDIADLIQNKHCEFSKPIQMNSVYGSSCVLTYASNDVGKGLLIN